MSWWKHIEWNGCLRGDARVDLGSAMAPVDILPPYSWHPWSIPTINQHGPSCVGQSWANWLEMMIRRHVGMDALKPGEQIDGYSIWKRAREMYHGGTLTGGLSLVEGYGAMQDLGIIPPDCQFVYIAPMTDAICLALSETPLVQGHMVHKGWYEPNPQNGCLDHSAQPGPGDGGHATCLIGHTIQGGQIFFVSQNSWGADYGYHGYFLMSEAEWFEGYLGDGPCTIAMPAGWQSWNGWKKYVTTEAK